MFEWFTDTPSDVAFTEHFSLSDFTASQTADNLGIPNDPNESQTQSLQALAFVLEDVRDLIGSFGILSAFRSQQLNDAVGGSASSRHLKGEGVDIQPYASNLEDAFAKILVSPVSDKLGEITIKPNQGTLHLSLPFTSWSGYVQGSARIKDPVSGQYRTLFSDEISYYTDLVVSSVGPVAQDAIESAVQSLKGGKGVQTTTILLSTLFFGAGVLAVRRIAMR